MRILISSVLIFIVTFSFAQNNVEFKKSNFAENKEGFRKALSNLLDGNEYFEQGADVYGTALEFYLKANDFNSNNAKLNYKIGVCYINAGNKEKASGFFKKAASLDENVSYDIHYMLGLAYQYSYDFNNAIEEFGLFKSTQSISNTDEWRNRINKRIEECNFGKKIVKDSLRVTIENLGSAINSKYSDHSPLISADESMMIFTSRRENTTGGGRDPYDYQYFEDIYVSYNINGEWQKAKNIGTPLNTNLHDATVGLSFDGQQLFIYSSKKNNRGDIYKCKIKGDKWGSPVPLPYTINSNFQETSACFSHDGKIIYFVSDKVSDNYGGKDIYKSVLLYDGKWDKAENLGGSINTKHDEDAVYMHPDGKTLYFSSKGHENMGGYDIFKSSMKPDGGWSTPVNIGYPINTPADDVFFVMSANGKHGYFSSMRKDCMGEKDIYRVTFISEDDIEDENVLVTIVKGSVTDAITGDNLEANIEIIDNEKNEIIAEFNSNAATGNYLVSLPSGKNYGIVVDADDYLFHSENFNLPEGTEFQEFIKDITLNKVAEGSQTILNNIFFDYARATIKSESYSELDRVVKTLNAHPTMRIEISGHTDNQNSLTTNNRLSTARAKSVVDYIVLKGIDRSRLEYKGYAFYNPIASNDTEEGRELNRRVEFKILSK